jgi:hypothetical protein
MQARNKFLKKGGRRRGGGMRKCEEEKRKRAIRKSHSKPVCEMYCVYWRVRVPFEVMIRVAVTVGVRVRVRARVRCMAGITLHVFHERHENVRIEHFIACIRGSIACIDLPSTGRPCCHCLCSCRAIRPSSSKYDARQK